MKVVVDRDLCEANARCQEAAPQVVRADEEDHLHILIDKPGEELREKLDEAIRLCPRQALSIEES